MGETHVSPETVPHNHHHGDFETAIYVRSRNPEFIFHDGHGEVRIPTAPGDYVFVPPFVLHREENPDPSNAAVVVIARSTRELIVVNLCALYALPGDPGGRAGLCCFASWSASCPHEVSRLTNSSTRHCLPRRPVT
jgi:uncharacterized RmlC-like cupin family protein